MNLIVKEKQPLQDLLFDIYQFQVLRSYKDELVDCVCSGYKSTHHAKLFSRPSMESLKEQRRNV